MALSTVEQPVLAPLRRVTWGTVFQIAVLTFAALAVLRFVGNVEFDAVRDDFGDADRSWVAVAFVVAQLPRITQALASLGSIVESVRFGPCTCSSSRPPT